MKVPVIYVKYKTGYIVHNTHPIAIKIHHCAQSTLKQETQVDSLKQPGSLSLTVWIPNAVEIRIQELIQIPNKGFCW